MHVHNFKWHTCIINRLTILIVYIQTAYVLCTYVVILLLPHYSNWSKAHMVRMCKVEKLHRFCRWPLNYKIFPSKLLVCTHPCVQSLKQSFSRWQVLMALYMYSRKSKKWDRKPFIARWKDQLSKVVPFSFIKQTTWSTKFLFP